MYSISSGGASAGSSSEPASQNPESQSSEESNSGGDSLYSKFINGIPVDDSSVEVEILDHYYENSDSEAIAEESDEELISSYEEAPLTSPDNSSSEEKSQNEEDQAHNVQTSNSLGEEGQEVPEDKEE